MCNGFQLIAASSFLFRISCFISSAIFASSSFLFRISCFISSAIFGLKLSMLQSAKRLEGDVKSSRLLPPSVHDIIMSLWCKISESGRFMFLSPLLWYTFDDVCILLFVVQSYFVVSLFAPLLLMICWYSLYLDISWVCEWCLWTEAPAAAWSDLWIILLLWKTI